MNWCNEKKDGAPTSNGNYLVWMPQAYPNFKVLSFHTYYGWEDSEDYFGNPPGEVTHWAEVFAPSEDE